METAEKTLEERAFAFAETKVPTGYELQALHAYENDEGNVLFWRTRAKDAVTGEKWIRPIQLMGDTFELQEPAFSGGKPIYRLKALIDSPLQPVIVVEGEWCADKLKQHGVLATTSGGMNSAKGSDWSPLQGRDVTIWPDNDEPGYRYAYDVALQLLSLNCNVRIICPGVLDLKEKQDVVDWLQDHPQATAESVMNICGNAEEHLGSGIGASALSAQGFQKAEDDDSDLIFTVPQGVLALEVQGWAEIHGMKDIIHGGDAWNNTLKIFKPDAISLLKLFKWPDAPNGAAPIQVKSSLRFLLPGNTFTVPSNDRWTLLGGKQEMALLPISVPERWPILLQVKTAEVLPSVKNEPVPSYAKWPNPVSKAAYHGIMGDLLGIIAPETEADPAGLLVALLTGVGAMFENRDYIKVGAARHSTNLFSVIVGDSSLARKGTAISEARRVLQLTDPEFVSRMSSGLSTGEGLIDSVRDARKESVESKDSDELVVKTVDAGVKDKRLLVIENEFSKPLQCLARTGNTLSPVLREAWDGSPLKIMARSNKDRCNSPHIAILATITREELKSLMPRNEHSNGLANRILWVCARRARHLPLGGNIDEKALELVIARLREVMAWAKDERQVQWGDAQQMWEGVYKEIAQNEATGLYGMVTSRADAQILRIALIYALLDKSQLIQKAHLEAAFEVWRYCADSARYIYGDSIGGLPEQVLVRIRVAPHGMTLTELNNSFQGHKLSQDLKEALALLARFNLVEEEKESTGGKPLSRWSAKG